MIAIEWDELNRQGEWPRLLTLYAERQAAARQQNAESDGWVERLLQVEGIEPERLPKLHGRLIASGFLKIQLADRALGLQYQVSPEGRRALARLNGAPEDDSDDETPATEDAA